MNVEACGSIGEPGGGEKRNCIFADKLKREETGKRANEQICGISIGQVRDIVTCSLLQHFFCLRAALLAIPAEIRQEKLPKTNSSTSELLTTESRYFKFQPFIGGYNLRLTMDRPEVRA
jgi:hypothetical protein